MDIKKLQRKRKQRKDVVVSLRITKEDSKWLREKNISLTALFITALRELQNGNNK